MISDCYVICINALQQPFGPFKLSSIQDLNGSIDDAPSSLPGILRIISRNMDDQNHEWNLQNIVKYDDGFEHDDDCV